eukprot:6865519-Alexandrium_andersonii.AAC.1
MGRNCNEKTHVANTVSTHTWPMHAKAISHHKHPTVHTQLSTKPHPTLKLAEKIFNLIILHTVHTPDHAQWVHERLDSETDASMHP